jgi:peptide/nickel transport system permease protein
VASSTIQTHAGSTGRVAFRASLVGRALRLVPQKPLGAVATAILVILVLTAVFAGVLAPHDPDFIFQGQTTLPAGATAPDGRPFILGTDESGRDELARLIYGARVSLLVGILAVGVGTLGGTIVGLVSGYYGGKLDFIVQRVMDCQQSIPTLILALLLIAVLGRSLENVIFVIGVSQIPGTNRVVRSAVLAIKRNTYVDAARVVGCTDLRIIFRYIALNTMAPVIVVATTSLGGAIIAEAFLSFLGMGVPPPTASWGGMLAAARSYMIQNPQLLVTPAVALSLTVLGWNLAGDALRDILDPRLRRA